MSSPAFKAAFARVTELVSRFEKGRTHYMSASYQEAEARKSFIDPFWKALGWDVDHEEQHNPYEQEVRIERGQKQIGEASRKRADYAFFLAPDFKQEVFFVEAKKPFVDLAHPAHYFQTARYGYNAGCALSVLTDFEQFHIIDCRPRPNIKTAVHQGYRTYTLHDYLDEDKFSEIYWLFSREAVAAGNLRKAIEALPARGKGARQKALFSGGFKPIDEDFLEYIDRMRADLAKAFNRANKDLDGETLTEVTQRTVDRLVFIRFLEDKGLEPDDIVRHWTGWKDFVRESRRLDAKYNGVVFKYHAHLDDAAFAGAEEKAFLHICEDLAGTNNAYLFNYIPIHILGSIYERFLGKVITDKGGVEEKPEVRKAGGVYYTPKYIVDYIVQRTVGRLIEGKSPKEISTMRFADIACGSGSFLIGVYEYLLDYHRKWYAKKYGERTTPLDKRAEDFGLVEPRDGAWALTLQTKQDILLNNIFGVDLDPQAVEVSQLSLFLKMLEDESLATMAGRQLTLTSKVLPDLTKNIQSGNSLVGWDIDDGMFPNDELRRLNPFDWKASFPQVFRGGGFDALVGNPPYGMTSDEGEKNYLAKHYPTIEGRFDRYEVFIEKALKVVRQNGFVSFIIPSPFFTNLYTRKLRRFVAANYQIQELVNFEMPVFADPTVHACIVTIRHQSPIGNSVRIKSNINSEEELTVEESVFLLDQEKILEAPNNVIDVYADDASKMIIDKMAGKGRSLGEVCFIRQCIKTGNDPVYVRTSMEEPVDPWKKSLRGKSIGRYITVEPDVQLKYGDWLARNWKNTSFYETPKIAIRETGSRVTATLDLEHRYFLSSLYAVYFKEPKRNASDLLSLLAIINSSLANYYMQVVALKLTKGAFTKIRTNQLARLPVPFPFEPSTRDSLSTLVTSLLSTKAQLAEVRFDKDRHFLEQRAASLDRQIDELVYQLYGLTEEEIRLVEGAA